MKIRLRERERERERDLPFGFAAHSTYQIQNHVSLKWSIQKSKLQQQRRNVFFFWKKKTQRFNLTEKKLLNWIDCERNDMDRNWRTWWYEMISLCDCFNLSLSLCLSPKKDSSRFFSRKRFEKPPDRNQVRRGHLFHTFLHKYIRRSRTRYMLLTERWYEIALFSLSSSFVFLVPMWRRTHWMPIGRHGGFYDARTVSVWSMYVRMWVL